MPSTQSPAAAPSGFINWIRNIDIRKMTAVFATMTTIEMLIASGQISLDGALPVAWIPYIVKWCAILVVVNQVLNVGHITTAAKWPQPAAPGGFNARAAIALFFGVSTALALALPQPAHALVRHRHVAATTVPVPLSDPRLPANATLDAGKAAASAKLTAQQVQQNPLVLIQQFTTNDLNNAIALAQAQTPPDTVAVACWQVLLPIVQAAQTAPGGASAGNALQLGIATGIQDTRDAQSLIANLQSPTGPLAKVNTACAPVVVQLNTTLTLLGVGGGVVAAGGPAAATGAIGALNALLLALPKPIPLPIP